MNFVPGMTVVHCNTNSAENHWIRLWSVISVQFTSENATTHHDAGRFVPNCSQDVNQDILLYLNYNFFRSNMSETTYSFSPSKCGFTSLKCHMVANACGVKLVTASFAAPCYPALCITVTNKKANTSTNNVVFSANAICRYFIEATAGGQGLWISTNSNNSNVLNDLFALEEFTLVPALQTKNRSTVSAVLSVLEDATGKYHKLISVQPLLQLWLSPILDKCLTFIDTKFPFLSKIVADSKAGDAYKVIFHVLFC